MLLPLLIKEEMLNTDFWATNVGLAAVGAAIDSIVMEIRQHQDNSVSFILDTEQAPISPNSKETPSVVPMLKAYGASQEDK
jgi:hypothetical protein